MTPFELWQQERYGNVIPETTDHNGEFESTWVEDQAERELKEMERP